MITAAASVFGNVHLGYIVIESEKFADWRRFGRDAIGMHLDETRFRLYDHQCRFLLRRGPAFGDRHAVTSEPALRGPMPLSAVTKPPWFNQFKTRARSLLHREEVVPALAGAGIPDS